jgi:hypothetical protein
MQERLFCHISDSPALGYRQILPMAFIADRPVLWSPSGRQLQALGSADDPMAPCISPADLVRLVESDVVHVIGRNDWLNDGPGRAALEWAHAPWLDGFDDRLRAVLDADAHIQDRAAARVRTVKDEGGRPWVESEELPEPEATQRDELRQRIDSALRQDTCRLPAGIGERAERAASKAEPEDEHTARIDSIMRDLYNHEEALRISGARIPFALDTQWRTFELFRLEMPETDQPQIKAQRTPEPLAAEKMIRLIEVVAQLQRPTEMSEFIGASLRDPELPKLRDALWGLLSYDEQPDALLRGELARLARGLDWSELMGPAELLGLVALVLTLVSIRLGSYDIPTGVDLVQASVDLLLFGRITGRHYSLLPAPDVGESVRALSLFAQGTKQPTGSDLRTMLRSLREVDAYFNHRSSVPRQ